MVSDDDVGIFGVVISRSLRSSPQQAEFPRVIYLPHKGFQMYRLHVLYVGTNAGSNFSLNANSASVSYGSLNLLIVFF